MANMLLEEKKRVSTMVQTVPGISILKQNGEVLKKAPEDPAYVPDQGAILRPRYIQNRTNVLRRILASRTARRLSILFDMASTILLIVLLGDEEDDLRLHPAFVRSMETWRRQQRSTCD